MKQEDQFYEQICEMQKYQLWQGYLDDQRPYPRSKYPEHNISCSFSAFYIYFPLCIDEKDMQQRARDDINERIRKGQSIL